MATSTINSCTAGVCGTGGWAGPLPGDPSEVFGLTATAEFGGIQLKWNLPGVNPEAVAHTKVFRGFSDDPDLAVLLTEEGGSSYFDRTGPGEPLQVKYYWVRVLSRNGTLGELVGPASATAKPTIQQMLEMLSAQIDEGLLATVLRTKINQIVTLQATLGDEIQERLNGDATLQAAMSALDTSIGEVRTLVTNEITQRVDGQDVILQELSQLGVGANGDIALIQEQLTVQATAISVAASQITTLVGRMNDAESAIINEASLRNTAIEASALQLSQQMSTLHDETLAAVEEETSTRVTEDNALGQRITTLNGVVDDNYSVLQTDYYTKVATNSAISAAVTNLVSSTSLTTALGAYTTTAALQANYFTKTETTNAISTAQSSAVTTAQTFTTGAISSAQTTLQSNIDTVNGKVTDIGARYTAVLDVNGLVGGFGVYNNGTFVEAGFDVARFWVGSNSTDKIKPFIIDGGVTYIAEAAIQKLNFGKLRSDDGTLVVEGGKLKAAFIQVSQLDALSATIGLLRSRTTGARMEITNDVIRVYDDTTLRVKLGNLA